MPTNTTNPLEVCLVLVGVTVIGRSYVLLEKMWEVYFKEHIYMVEIQNGVMPIKLMCFVYTVMHIHNWLKHLLAVQNFFLL